MMLQIKGLTSVRKFKFVSPSYISPALVISHGFLNSIQQHELEKLSFRDNLFSNWTDNISF